MPQSQRFRRGRCLVLPAMLAALPDSSVRARATPAPRISGTVYLRSTRNALIADQIEMCQLPGPAVCLFALVGMHGAPGAQKQSRGDVAPPVVVVPSGQTAHSYVICRMRSYFEYRPISHSVQRVAPEPVGFPSAPAVVL